MKYLKLLSLYCLFFSLNLNSTNAQILKGHAKYSIQEIIHHGNSKDAELVSKLDSFIDKVINTNEVIFNLAFTKEQSVFYFEDEPNFKENKQNQFYFIAKNCGKYFMNHNTGKIFNEQSIGNSLYLIQSNAKEYDWILTKETKYIGNHFCKKAVTIKKNKLKNDSTKRIIIEAWYSEDIRISSGPMGYCGLPGLIVELKYGDKYIYSLVQETNSEPKFPEKPLDSKVITKEDFINLKANSFKE